MRSPILSNRAVLILLRPGRRGKGSGKTPEVECNFIERLRLLSVKTLDKPQNCRLNHMLDAENIKL
jgi:hypothetical protein